MKKVFLLAFATAFTAIACKDVKLEVGPSDGSGSGITIEHEDHSGHDHGDHNQGSDAQTSAPVSQGTAAASKDVKLNPAHGEPGHRCEIPVGAPLDGSAAPAQNAPKASNSGQGFLGSGNNQAAPAPSSPAQAIQQSGAAQQTAPGMQGKPNPAHGQPGHRCDVQVGQPLP